MGGRALPSIKKTGIKGYANLLASGFDTIVETFNMAMPDELLFRLKKAKEGALARDARKTAIVSLNFGGEELQIRAHGGRGAIFILDHPDFSMDIRSEKTDWNISIRYSSCGLWQYGVKSMRERVSKMLLQECFPKTDGNLRWAQLSCAHVAFDFYSEAFTSEMRPEILGRFVSHSSSKKHMNFEFKPEKGSAWGRAGYLETVTLGNKKTVEVQVYNKGKEITEVSGKTWMYKVWEREGYYPPEDQKAVNVWRLEVRFGKDYLDNRNIKTFENFSASLPEVIAEALFSKRLTIKNEDINIRRRPLHPLWAMAWDNSGAANKMLPIGKQLEKSGDVYFQMMRAQNAGLQRAMAQLSYGCSEEEDMMEMARMANDHAKNDKDHDLKSDKVSERYKHLHVARG